MALVKGICKNFGECDMADNKEIQEVEKSNFVCEECGKPLHPVEGTTKKLIPIIGGAVVALAAIGGGIYALTGSSSGEKEPPQPQVTMALNHTERTLKVGESDTLTATLTPSNVLATVLFQTDQEQKAVEVSNGIVTAKAVGEAKVQVQAIAGSAPQLIVSYERKGKTLSVEADTVLVATGRAACVENLKNGKPHGHGTITYNTRRKVVSWRDEVANPGDKFEGDFRDGVINGLGYLKTRDGNVVAIQ